MGGATSILEQADGKVLLGGTFRGTDFLDVQHFVRLTATGEFDTTFKPEDASSSGAVFSMATDATGKILVAGRFSTFRGKPRLNIARLEVDGSLDETFDPGMLVSGSVMTVAVQPDGRILLGGFSAGQRSLLRINRDGSADDSFNSEAAVRGNVFCMMLQSDGRILIGGKFQEVNGVPIQSLARFNANGTLDLSFQPKFFAGSEPGTIMAMVAMPDGRIVVGGWFTTANGLDRRYLARLGPDGRLDQSFAPNGGPNDGVFEMTLQGSETLLIGGQFYTVNGIFRPGLARLRLFDARYAANMQDQVLVSPAMVSNDLLFSWSSATNTRYRIEYKDAFSDAEWRLAGESVGDGTFMTATNRVARYGQRFFRIRGERKQTL